MTRVAALLVVICAVALPSFGEETVEADAPAGGAGWSVGLEAYYTLLDDGSFLLPIVSADRGWLHLEGRYQYEDLRTTSIWAGWNFESGKALELEVVPMAGVVVGRTDGLAAGLELTLDWRSLELYSENEFVFDLGDSEGDFFYSWSEFSWQVQPWLRLGLSPQVTRERGADLAIDNGILVGFAHGPAEVILYGFNLGGDDTFYIFGLTWDF